MKRRRRFWIAWAVVALLAVAWGCWRFWPATGRECQAGVVEACARSWYAVEVPGGDTLYFTSLCGDTVLHGLSPRREASVRTFRANAFFVSPTGRLLTSADTVAREALIPARVLRGAMRHASARLSARLADYQSMLSEMAYYARTHSVADEGFHAIVAHAERLRADSAELARCKRMVDTLLSAGGATAWLHEVCGVGYWTGADGLGDWKEVGCRRLPADSGCVAVWQTLSCRLPDGVSPFRLNFFPYGWFHWGRTKCTWWGLWGRHGRSGRDLRELPSPLGNFLAAGHPVTPLVDGADGAPAFGRCGNLNGMWAGGRFVSAAHLYIIEVSHTSWLRSVWGDLRAWVDDWRERPSVAERTLPPLGRLAYVAYSCRDTSYYGQTDGTRPQGEGVMCYPDGSRYEGRWKNGLREGFGIHTDVGGRRCTGVWQADTLPRGEAFTAGTRYEGCFDRNLQAHGEGVSQGADDSFHAGLWSGGLPDGFGFSSAPRELVKCGVWKQGRFRGERIIHHSNRVYGIDISKYQHMHKNRRCGIDWKRLRISHLGRMTRKQVDGEMGYPVSFVYIKSTEGATVTNPYYAQDARAARRHGFRVGSYHFFTTSPAGEQVGHFLKKSDLRRGDLPPMLDVELSDRKIDAMGGRDSLFQGMLAWLQAVERQCGTAPVVYVNQDFVNRHYPFAPERLKAYPVWVARYGEYRPYVRLLYWQLSPDGTVDGIRGHVDINVFNGTEEMFKDYVREHAVR